MNRVLWLAALVLAVPASAALPPSLALKGESPLRPGQYLWDEAGSGTGPVAVMVSIDRQHLYVYRDAVLIGVSTVSTGKPGKATPVGAFRILQKNVFHRSNLYSNAPMPYMQRLTWGGIAIHGGELPGYPASHGCIRVPLAFAKKLFAATDMGGVVTVSDGQGGPSLRIEADIAALPADSDPAWSPSAEPVRLAVAKPARLAMAVPRITAQRLVALPVAVSAPVPKPVRIALDSAALNAAATAEVLAPRDTSQPHWRVPYYSPSAPTRN